MSESIAFALKDNRRLATFRLEKPQEFVDYLKTRYDSEINVWLDKSSTDDWKYPFILREQQIRALERRIRRLEELAEVW